MFIAKPTWQALTLANAKIDIHCFGIGTLAIRINRNASQFQGAKNRIKIHINGNNKSAKSW